MTEHEGAEHQGYGDWRSLALAIKDAATKAARDAGPGISDAGPGISAATVDAQIHPATSGPTAAPADA